MLRGEDILCGTSSTGTGTLTLAAQPAPPGGADFYHWLTATGIGFVNGNALLVSYTIIEYTTSGFVTQSQLEKGVGTLTLGASLTASTLARTTVQVTATGLNGTAAYNVSAPSAINIGTAANTLVFVGAAAADTIDYPPYFEASLGDAIGVLINPGGTNINTSLTTSTVYYVACEIKTPMLAKRMSVRVGTAYTGGTTNAYGALYAVGTDGRPGKLLYDFGLMGSSGTSLNSGNTNISSGAAGNGFFVTPGVYWASAFVTFTGGSGTPTFRGVSLPAALGLCGTSSGVLIPYTTATGGASTPPDPANQTGYAAGSSNSVNVWLKAS